MASRVLLQGFRLAALCEGAIVKMRRPIETPEACPGCVENRNDGMCMSETNLERTKGLASLRLISVMDDRREHHEVL